MRLKINLDGFLEDVQDLDAIPYLLKMYLREVLDLDIHIDPKIRMTLISDQILL